MSPAPTIQHVSQQVDSDATHITQQQQTRSKDHRTVPPSSMMTRLVCLIGVLLLAVAAIPANAQSGEETFLDGITAVSDIINLNLRYIANETSPGSEQFVCRHGPNECAGDILQLCVRSIYPETRDWFDFVVCMSKNASNIPMNGEECASQFDFDWSEIDSCTKNGQGLQLLQDSISYVHPGTNETISCTINMEQTFWCQHNEDWFGCTEGTTSEDFIRAVCKRYQGTQKPTACQQYQQQQSTSITTTTEEEKETEREIPSTPSQTPAIALE